MLKGIYLLIIRLDANVSFEVGALGEVSFTKGFYVYIGSAQNSLKQRVKRHLRNDKRLFWHIDYLLNSKHAQIHKIFYKEVGKEEECTVAQETSQVGKPVRGFGCSDCNCKSHLFHLDDYEIFKKYLKGNFDIFQTKIHD